MSFIKKLNSDNNSDKLNLVFSSSRKRDLDDEITSKGETLELKVEQVFLLNCGISYEKAASWDNDKVLTNFLSKEELDIISSLEVFSESNISLVNEVRKFQILFYATKELDLIQKSKQNFICSSDIRSSPFFIKYSDFFFDNHDAKTGFFSTVSSIKLFLNRGIFDCYELFWDNLLKNKIKMVKILIRFPDFYNFMEKIGKIDFRLSEELISLDQRIFCLISEKLKGNINLIKRLIRLNPFIFEYLPLELQKDHDLAELVLLNRKITKNEFFINNFPVFNDRRFLIDVALDNSKEVIEAKYPLLYEFKNFVEVVNEFEKSELFHVNSNKSEEELKQHILTRAQYKELKTNYHIEKSDLDVFSKIVENASYDQMPNGYEELCYLSLEALKQDKISTRQFSTLMIYFTLLQDRNKLNLKIVPLFFEDGELNLFALDSILQTWKKETQNKKSIYFLNTEKIVRWLNLMKLAPKSEQVFFSIDVSKKEKYEPSIIKRIAIDLNLTPFTYFFDRFFKQRRMVVTSSMKQAFLDVLNPQNPTTLTPCIGLSSLHEISLNGLESSRDEALPFYGLKLPKEADGLICETFWDFNHHDFYHAYISSYIPDEIRKLTIKLQSDWICFFDLKKLDCAVVFFMEKFAEKLIDMEFVIFRKDFLKINLEPQQAKILKLLVTFDFYLKNIIESNFKEDSKDRESFIEISYKMRVMHIFAEILIKELQKLLDQNSLKNLVSQGIELMKNDKIPHEISVLGILNKKLSKN